MRLARASVGLTALVYAGFGAVMLVAPEVLGAVGIELRSAAARTEVRSIYGGLELGLALFLGLSAARGRWLEPALVVQAATLGGAALGRAVGLAVDGGVEALVVGLLCAEACGAALGVVALVRLRAAAVEPG